jgi:hypothetical protein
VANPNKRSIDSCSSAVGVKQSKAKKKRKNLSAVQVAAKEAVDRQAIINERAIQTTAAIATGKADAERIKTSRLQHVQLSLEKLVEKLPTNIQIDTERSHMHENKALRSQRNNVRWEAECTFNHNKTVILLKVGPTGDGPNCNKDSLLFKLTINQIDMTHYLSCRGMICNRIDFDYLYLVHITAGLDTALILYEIFFFMVRKYFLARESGDRIDTLVFNGPFNKDYHKPQLALMTKFSMKSTGKRDYMFTIADNI